MHIDRVKNVSGRARTEVIMVRLSTAELEAAKAKATAVGVTVSELVRQLLAGLRPRAQKKTAIVGMPEVRKVAALLGHALRSANPAERAQLVSLYRDVRKHFVQLQVRAEALQEAEDGLDHQES